MTSHQKAKITSLKKAIRALPWNDLKDGAVGQKLHPFAFIRIPWILGLDGPIFLKIDISYSSDEHVKAQLINMLFKVSLNK